MLYTPKANAVSRSALVHTLRDNTTPLGDTPQTRAKHRSKQQNAADEPQRRAKQGAISPGGHLNDVPQQAWTRTRVVGPRTARSTRIRVCRAEERASVPWP